MVERILAPCMPEGKVKSCWDTDIDGGDPGMYSVIDNDSKEVECRCPFGACCVNGRNEVIYGISININKTSNPHLTMIFV